MPLFPQPVKRGDPVLAVDENMIREVVRGLLASGAFPGVSDGATGVNTSRTTIPRTFTYPAYVLPAGGASHGRYSCVVLNWKFPIPDGDLTWNDIADNDRPLDDNGVLLNQPEIGRNVARIDAGSNIFVSKADTLSAQGRQVWVVNYAFGVRGLRTAPDLSAFQYTTEDSETQTWVNWQLLTTCDAENPSMFPASRIAHSSGQTAEDMLSQHDQIVEVAFEQIATFGELPITGNL